MERISDKDIEWLLKPNQDFNYKTEERLEKVQKLSFKRKAIRFGLWALLILTLTILPFFLLIKTSIYLNIDQGLNGWVSLWRNWGNCSNFIGVCCDAVSQSKNKKLVFRYGLGGVGALVGGFCLYGLLYVSSVNAKSDSVKEVYRSLHPILRVAVATTTLAEGDLVITDIKRSAEDYVKMGLPINQSSLHFPQPDGYVHAIDLRTKGHSEFRNFMLSNSLRLMGFKTLRHVGSADHLHISLPYSEH